MAIELKQSGRGRSASYLGRILPAAAVLLLAGCFNDIRGPANSLLWLSGPLTLEQYRGDNGELQHVLDRQNGVLDMAFDANAGLFWVLRKNGDLSAYDADTSRVHFLQLELRGPKKAFLRAHGNAVWLAQDRSLTLLSAQGAQWRRDIAAEAQGIELDAAGNLLWVLTEKKILAYDSAGVVRREVDLPKKPGSHSGPPAPAADRHPGPIAYDAVNGRILVATDKMLLSYGTDGVLLRYAAIERIEHLIADIAGGIWAADNKKLYRINSLTLAVISSKRVESRIERLQRDPFNAGVWVLAGDALGWVDGQGRSQGGFYVGPLPKTFAVAYRLQSGERPRLTIVQPAEQALVGPDPEFLLKASDASGINLSSFGFKVNAVAVPSICGADAAQAEHYRCSLQALLYQIAQSTDARYRIEVTVADNDGMLSLPAAVTVLLDRDRDGVNDALDQCPDTPPPEAADANGCSVSQRDADHDGVTDNLDLCPATPAGEAVDAFGCSASQRDSDDDGVTDNLDQCPATPAGEQADAQGCAASQRDSDGDGVKDNFDLCPGTPAGAPVHADGCADLQLDSDNDGVNDALDQCPNTPFPEAADANGCSASQRDSDHDGVTDNLDLCPATPDGEAVDAFGCAASQLDSDDDGVSDNLDQCPATPAGEQADAFGCAASQRDGDGDGVNDNLDRCPATPAGEPVDGEGCAASERDSDGDGVKDDLDQCPGTPEGEPVGTDGCAPSQRDTDDDGVTDDLDQCPATPAGAAAGADGCADFERDTDHDGVPDTQDAFPNDPARSRLPAVRNTAAVLQGAEQRILVTWQAPQNPENVHAYYVYRAEGVSGDLQRISAEPVTGLSFVDANIANGNLYRYRVLAVTANGLEGEAGELATVFAAFNNAVVQGLTAERQPVAVRLQWQALPGQRYRVYRAVGDSGFNALSDLAGTQYTDNAVVWSSDYHYRVAGLLDFAHPETGEVLTVEGPPSSIVTAPALAPLQVTVFDVNPAGEVFEKIVNAQTDLTVSGRYVNAIGPVQITATAGGSSFTAAGDNGNFRLSLPAMPTGTVWSLVFTETTVADRSATLLLRVLLDAVAPVITLDNPAQTVLDSQSFRISGTATDNSGTVVSITVTSDRFAGTDFGVLTEGGNRFSAEVPLLPGANRLAVTARDAAGNIGQAMLTVNRNIGLAPNIEIHAPVNGTIVQSDRVDVSGRLYTSLPPDKIRLVLGGQILFPVAAAPGVYNFNFTAVPLQPGVNNLSVRAETAAGNATAVVGVIYQDQAPPVGPDQAPVIQITSPGLSNYTRNDSIVIAGFVAVTSGTAALRINNTPVDLAGQNPSQGYFQYLADLSGIEGEAPFTLLASDGANRTTSRTLRITRDTQQPLISLDDTALQVPPAVNTVVELPFLLKGQVRDANLAGLSINGNTIDLRPTAESTVFMFNAALNLPAGENRSAVLLAWDHAGNSAARELILNADPRTAVEIISPRAGETLRLSGSQPTVAVVARLSLIDPGYTATAQIDQGAPVTMVVDGNVLTAQIPVQLASTSHSLVIRVTDQGGATVAAVSGDFHTEDLANIPLVLARTEPANGDSGVEPNVSINLYFNKPIDPDLLQISVRETVSGLTFDTSRPAATDFPSLENAEPVEVHRNQEPVPGTTGFLPGNTVAVYLPARDIAYGAEVFIDVGYDGAELGRFSYRVRPIPTFAQGVVIDQSGQPVAGVTVELPDLEMSTQTDGNGNYSFGFGLDAARSLPAGRHSIVFNPGMLSPKFGGVQLWANIQSGRLNRLGAVTLPLLNNEIAFRPVSGGQQQVLLAEGELTLDLAGATLQFPDGRGGGNMHVQFTPAQHFSYQPLRSAIPHWLYAMQPIGVRISGTVGITIQMPALLGSYEYVPPNGTRVLMIGLDPDSRQLLPVGVGEVQDRKVLAQVRDLKILDFIGYAIVDYRFQELLTRYADGAISLASLIRELESSVAP